ncbi:MAG: carbohydrate ABC transporter permease [Lachnospiraceae bacterium]|nr:carbohydrate ABC transporter permease [Lachnospiraceae bacterium]
MAKTKQEKLDAKAEKQYNKTHKKQYKYSAGDIVFYIFNYAFFTIFTVSCIFPFYYLFINTISDNAMVIRGAITFVPHGIHLQNYIKLFSGNNDLFQAFKITVLRTVLGTALMVLSTAFVGYIVTKREMWHRTLWYRLMLITMYFNAGLVPAFMNMSMLGLTNTFAAYIIPSIVVPYNIILVKTYIESIPAELEESAQMDGAGYMKVFFSIVLPLCKPILATITIFGAVGHWNSFTDSLMYMRNAPDLHTLQHKLYTWLNTTSNLGAIADGGGGSSVSDVASNLKINKYTISMITIIPILCVYPFMQRYFEKGIMLGAVKG